MKTVVISRRAAARAGLSAPSQKMFNYIFIKMKLFMQIGMVRRQNQ